MYPLLILREEIICLIILIFFWGNGIFYKMGKDHGSYMRMCMYATGHVIFDIITVLTVNNLDTVPPWVNLASHVIFYMFAILFAQEFFCYIITLCYRKSIERAVRAGSYLILLLYLCCLPALPIEYLEGKGTNYSLGKAAYVGYAVAMLFFVFSAVIVALRRKVLPQHVRYALVPIIITMVAAECIQIAVPELLFTGGVATVITVGFFFSLENPAHVFRQKLQVDALTGVKSRSSFESDIRELEELYRQDPREQFALVFCDINNLKMVNDVYGHLDGDTYIGEIAQILMENLSGAEDIYRMGGDEFVAVYHGKEEELVLGEIRRVSAACEAAGRESRFKHSIAMGYAVSGEQYPTLQEVLRVADYMMYKNKAEMKKQTAFVSEDGQKLNVVGLTDRIFDAFAATGDRNYLTLCNMSTNVSRWSKSAVDYFGLPGEFIFDCASIWMEYIHPDDRADYWADITAVMNGKKKYHALEYRARNKQGEYVMCTCRGTILRGKNGEPDMFAATLVNHGIAESIDPVTGLHNEQVLIPYVQDIIDRGEEAVFLAVDIRSFGRITVLYGQDVGNMVLRQFSSIMKRICGDRGEIFRMDGPVFFLCIQGGNSREIMAIYGDLQDLAGREIKVNDMSVPLRLGGGAFVMDKSFGENSTTVRNNLTHALERSEQENHGKLVFYGDPVLSSMVGDFHLLASIHQDAIAERKGFFLRYQPLFSIADKRMVGAEALLRWRDEAYGEVTPGQFVPWLENDPSFYQLGRWILHRALSDGRELLELDPDFTINVNVTVLQLEDERFGSMVLEVLRETAFPALNLCLELTERCRELDFEFLAMKIDFFRRYGIRVVMDDVGTGFSSIGILLRLPVDGIKLDKSFVTDIRERRSNQAFVGAIVTAANQLGYRTCLEGIEDEETFEFIKQYEAKICQGYYFARPLLLDDLKERLRGEKG